MLLWILVHSYRPGHRAISNFPGPRFEAVVTLPKSHRSFLLLTSTPMTYCRYHLLRSEYIPRSNRLARTANLNFWGTIILSLTISQRTANFLHLHLYLRIPPGEFQLHP